MATEKYANLAKTTLNGNIDNVTTSITVLDASLFPSSSQFTIVVDTEIMIVTTGDNSTVNWTVIRGAEGSTAIAHSTGAVVFNVLTAGIANRIQNYGYLTPPPDRALTINLGSWTAANSLLTNFTSNTFAEYGVQLVRSSGNGNGTDNLQYYYTPITAPYDYSIFLEIPNPMIVNWAAVFGFTDSMPNRHRAFYVGMNTNYVNLGVLQWSNFTT